jgi:uncharacterized protein YkwD
MPRILAAIGLAVSLALAGGAASASAATTAELLAPATACPNQTDASLPAVTQQTAMACLVNYARTRSGLPALATNAKLTNAAVRKAADIVTCNQFSHTACGLPFDQRIRDAGYVYRAAGENIAWGSGSYATVRSTMTNWLNSAGHKANILSSTYRDQGIAVQKATFNGYPGAQIWVHEFGAPR